MNQQADNQIIQRLKIRLQDSGNDPEDVDQLCLDGLGIKKFTMSIYNQLLKFTNVQYLTCNYCEIETLQGFPTIQSIVALQLIGNKLKNDDLKYLKCFPNVQQIALDQNQIQNFDNFQQLNNLKDLQHIQIRGNPVCSISEYRGKIFEIAPKLKIVDCQDIFGDQDVMYGTETDSEDSDDLINNDQNENDQQNQECVDNQNEQDEQFGYRQPRRRH